MKGLKKQMKRGIILISLKVSHREFLDCWYELFLKDSSAGQQTKEKFELKKN